MLGFCTLSCLFFSPILLSFISFVLRALVFSVFLSEMRAHSGAHNSTVFAKMTQVDKIVVKECQSDNNF